MVNLTVENHQSSSFGRENKKSNWSIRGRFCIFPNRAKKTIPLYKAGNSLMIHDEDNSLIQRPQRKLK